MKKSLLFLLGVLPFTMAGTCSDHPKIDQIEQLISGLESEVTADEFTAISTAFSNYKDGNGDSAWTTLLTGTDNQCTGFSGNSCCTDDFVQHFKTIFKGNVKKEKKNEKPQQLEFLKHFGKQLGKCKGKQAVQDFLDLQGVQDFLEGMKACRKESSETQLNFVRRNFCTLCFSGAEMSSKFDNDGKLIVSQASIDAYEAATLQTFTCLENINADLFTLIQNHYNDIESDITEGESKACDRFADWIYNILQIGADALKPTKPAAGECKSQAKMFGKGCEEKREEGDKFEQGGEMGPKGADGQGGAPGDGRPPKQQQQDGDGQQQQEGDGQQQQDGQSPPPPPPSGAKRFLTGDDTDFSAASSGYDVYIDQTSTLDGDIVTSSFTGDEQVDLDVDSITIEQDPTGDDDTTDSSSKLSMAISLFVITIANIV